MKTIEILYPELCGIYGDKMNMKYLSKCSNKLKFIETSHKDIPYFIKHNVDMIYIGPMTENMQEVFINTLMPYKKEVKKLIEDGKVFFVTGNALEIFGKYIMDGKRKIKCLDIFDYYAVRDRSDVLNYQGIGKFNEFDVIIHKVLFSKCYGKFNPFIIKDSGLGMNDTYPNEGVHYKNFFGTYSLGPFLITNPLFTEYLLKLLGLKDEIAYKDDIIDAYLDRLNKMR